MPFTKPRFYLAALAAFLASSMLLVVWEFSGGEAPDSLDAASMSEIPRLPYAVQANGPEDAAAQAVAQYALDHPSNVQYGRHGNLVTVMASNPEEAARKAVEMVAQVDGCAPPQVRYAAPPPTPSIHCAPPQVRDAAPPPTPSIHPAQVMAAGLQANNQLFALRWSRETEAPARPGHPGPPPRRHRRRRRRKAAVGPPPSRTTCS